MRTNVQGTIYLLCFRDPLTGSHKRYKHAGHYIGFTENLESRITEHKSGGGARLIYVIQKAGLSFECTRTWNGTRALEREIKNKRAAYRLCPFCHAGNNARKLATARARRLKKAVLAVI